MTRATSFDVFDTLITRAVAAPTSLFLLMGRLPDVARLTSCSPEEFAQVRIAAERRARVGRGEVTLAEIYAELNASLPLRDGEADRLLELELALERRLSRMVPGAATLVKESNHPRFAVSDMYLADDFVCELLDRHGLLASLDQVYVSSRYGVSKSSGELFQVVMRDHGLHPREMLHLGDNAFADARVPRLLGLQTELIRSTSLNRYERLLEQEAGNTGGLASLFAGASRLTRLAFNVPAEQQAIVDVCAGVAGPVLTAYVLWVLTRAKADGVARLYFLARDGEILYVLARRLCERLGYDFDLRYLYGSRRVFMQAGLAEKELETAQWAWQTTLYRLTTRTVLKRLGLQPDAVDEHLHRLGLTATAEAPVTDDAVRVIAADTLLAQAVQASAAGLLQRLQSYLRQEGFCDGTTYAVVDTGWAGRTVQALADVLPADAAAMHRAYFFGYVKAPDGVRRPDLIRGYLYDEIARTGVRESIERAFGPLETFTVTNHGMTVDYRVTDDGIQPQLAGDTNPALGQWPWHLQREVLLRFVEEVELAPELTNLCADMRTAVSGVLAEFWERPTKAEAMAWGAFHYEDDLLASSRNSLARPMQARDFVRKLTDRNYQGKCLWEAGGTRLTPTHLRPFVTAGFRMNARIRAHGSLGALLSARTRQRVSLLKVAAQSRRQARQ